MRPVRAARPLLLLAVALAAAPPACASGLSERIERWLGSLTRSMIENSVDLDRDPLLEGMLEHIGERIASAGVRPGLEWRFRVVEVDDVNAISAPGGFVWVTKGALEYVESPDELAAIVGHEAAHVDCRHGWKSFEQDMAFIALMFAAGPHVAAQALEWADNAYFLAGLKFSREDEYEADIGGWKLALAGGYDARESSAFLARLLAEPDGDIGRFEALFTTHPRNRDRLARFATAAPDSEQLRFEARGLLARGLFAQSLEAWEASLAHAESAEARRGAAACSAFLGDPDRASRHLERAREVAGSAFVTESGGAERGITLERLASAPRRALGAPRLRAPERDAVAVSLASAAAELGEVTEPEQGRRWAEAATETARRALRERTRLLADLTAACASPSGDEAVAALARRCADGTSALASAAAATFEGRSEHEALAGCELDTAVWRIALEALRSPVGALGVWNCAADLLALPPEYASEASATTGDAGLGVLIAGLMRQRGLPLGSAADAVLRADAPSAGARACGGDLGNLAIACRLLARSLERESEARARLMSEGKR